ncbi:Armadillo-type fold [Pseudocohnilembus persalinus]|uniref:MMS19 nucleotide excision repair protein n=1 Tax=Pseudocohnilembus persalinus TaxID=266149 RepID=A0A0V0QF69_PSEPJ|nr:Armadillo-type fold [Pseudocohnilembus persalinus]|eukprot:KRX00847.1 Armadillo-type fold [Pseudocohnilembus persalinus]
MEENLEVLISRYIEQNQEQSQSQQQNTENQENKQQNVLSAILMQFQLKDIKVLDFFSSLQYYLTNGREQTRQNALNLVYQVFLKYNSLQVYESDFFPLLEFFLKKIYDVSLILQSIQIVNLMLVRYKNLQKDNGFKIQKDEENYNNPQNDEKIFNIIFEHIESEKLEISQYSRLIRVQFYALIYFLIQNYPNLCFQKKENFIQHIIRHTEDEKDPRNIKISFQIILFVLEKFPANLLEEHRETLFDNLECYYPIEMNSAQQENNKNEEINQEELQNLLSVCLCTKPLLKTTIGLLTEKIASENNYTLLSALKTFQYIFQENKILEQIHIHFQKQVQNEPSEDIILDECYLDFCQIFQKTYQNKKIISEPLKNLQQIFISQFENYLESSENLKFSEKIILFALQGLLLPSEKVEDILNFFFQKTNNKFYTEKAEKIYQTILKYIQNDINLQNNKNINLPQIYDFIFQSQIKNKKIELQIETNLKYLNKIQYHLLNKIINNSQIQNQTQVTSQPQPQPQGLIEETKKYILQRCSKTQQNLQLINQFYPQGQTEFYNNSTTHQKEIQKSKSDQQLQQEQTKILQMLKLITLSYTPLSIQQKHSSIIMPLLLELLKSPLNQQQQTYLVKVLHYWTQNDLSQFDGNHRNLIETVVSFFDNEIKDYDTLLYSLECLSNIIKVPYPLFCEFKKKILEILENFKDHKKRPVRQYAIFIINSIHTMM